MKLTDRNRMECTKKIMMSDGSKVLAFQCGWCSFGMTSRNPFKRMGTQYKSLHHYIESRKAALFEDDNIHDTIVKSNVAKEVAELSRQIKGYSEDRWQENVEKITRAGLNYKLSQNTAILDALKKTE